MKKGGFTLPGEAGYEELTLRLARQWGADVIRDSDGTALSEELMKAGYDIYSTLCIIRDHNEWARKHPEHLQQTFLMSAPVMAGEGTCRIRLLSGYDEEQFRINAEPRAMRFWQVFDRTEDREEDRSLWRYEEGTGSVVIPDPLPFHEYTVNFLVYRIWEEISMYNHVTNDWESEHLMPVDPRSPEAQRYLYSWLDRWCREHPHTNVVRFTSMFYNFVWIWGADERNRNLFTDWGSYDFTVSPEALESFEEEYGYALTAEDFINRGRFHVTHMPPEKKQRDYMRFTNRFVVRFGRELVKLVHTHGKKAYVFYDDSWIGVEPYSDLFEEFGFDGLIKCVFSGFEARLCAGVKAAVHEIRLHPYLFPVGLGGKPTFSEGGDPEADAAQYWRSVRRALLREPVDRIGLGGYLHLLEAYPQFCSRIEELADEFRTIRALHAAGPVYTLPVTVAVVHAWGALRSWTLSGHFHETAAHDLIHINEALSGLPVRVKFISFEEVKQGGLKGVQVAVNAGRAGTAWSGGAAWDDPELVAAFHRWVWEGGTLIGVNEPSAREGHMDYFRLAPALGVDEDTGARVCHGKWRFDLCAVPGLIPEGASIAAKENRFLTDGMARVLLAEDGVPALSVHSFGKGRGIYLSEFRISNANTRLLLNLILFGAGIDPEAACVTDNPETECAYFPGSGKLVLINNSEAPQRSCATAAGRRISAELPPFGAVFADVPMEEAAGGRV
ncbi:1,3-beta-galactosyl-N-acetylhexosamine phosphorylase [Lachnoclostridium sp. Marseille-P6806]|uniref:1,3-beta-galactosyl-N-acetylhexosamine phosphorylase n=1 Tax=Lachnoclostridium sp. Marseille-P6806 TaxID=2364793 RepID=UPI00103050CD|nr:1,3-beta-galactosyl-N-acetylhexosamine phosphorylase [Lachnoclostridium sp. Marseille-P6806]